MSTVKSLAELANENMYKQQFKPLIVTRRKQDLYLSWFANLEHENIGKGNQKSSLVLWSRYMENNEHNKCINQVICIGPAFDTSVLG